MAKIRQLRIENRITDKVSESFDKYLSEISKIDLISSEEEVELTRLIKEGDKPALEKLVSANLRFVVSVAKQYRSKGLSLEDLVNEGNLGLIKAAERFDATRGFKFISYAVWWIRQSIMVALDEKSRTVRLPANKFSLGERIRKFSASFEQKNDRPPSDDEISNSLKVGKSVIKDLFGGNGNQISLDKPLNESFGLSSFTRADSLEDKDGKDPHSKIMEEWMSKEILSSLEKLTEREAKVIVLYFGLKGQEPHSHKEIAEKMSVTLERTRQIKIKAMDRMKKMPKIKKAMAQLN